MAMKVAAVKAIAGYVTDEELSATYLLPNALDMNLPNRVAEKVAEAAAL